MGWFLLLLFVKYSSHRVGSDWLFACDISSICLHFRENIIMWKIPMVYNVWLLFKTNSKKKKWEPKTRTISFETDCSKNSQVVCSTLVFQIKEAPCLFNPGLNDHPTLLNWNGFFTIIYYLFPPTSLIKMSYFFQGTTLIRTHLLFGMREYYMWYILFIIILTWSEIL